MSNYPENFNGDKLDAIHADPTEAESIGDDELEFLRGIKQDFFDLIDKIKKHTNLPQETFTNCVVEAEEVVNDMLYKAWWEAGVKASRLNLDALPQTTHTMLWREELQKKIKEKGDE